MGESKGEDVCRREGRWGYFIGKDNGTFQNDITIWAESTRISGEGAGR